MNLIFSYSTDEDHHYGKQGHRFLGAGEDKCGVEIHVFEKISPLLKDLPKKIRDLTAEVRFQSKECYSLAEKAADIVTEILEE